MKRERFKFKSMALLLFALVLSSNQVWGAGTTTKTCTVTSTTGTSSPVTIDDVAWSFSTENSTGSPSVTNASYSKTYGLKFGSSSTNYWGKITFSTSYFSDKNITSVTANILNNGSKAGTLTVKQGSTTIGTATQTFGTTWTDLTANTTKGSGGTLEITYEVAQASYFHSFTITYEEGSSYTIAATVNEASYGSVEVSGTTITAKPNTGYCVNTADPYKVTSGTAVVTYNGDNTFSVTPSSNCNIQVNLKEVTHYTVSFYNNGTKVSDVQTTTNDNGKEVISSFPDMSSASFPHPSSNTFAGWTKDVIADNVTTTIDTSKIFDGTVVVKANMSVNALWATTTDGEESTFNASDINNLNDYMSSYYYYQEKTTKVYLCFGKATRYTSGTPNTFTVSKDDDGDVYFYLESENKIFAQFVTTISGEVSEYGIGFYSDGELSTSGSVQTITNVNTYLPFVWANENKTQMRVVSVVAKTYTGYITSYAPCTAPGTALSITSANTVTTGHELSLTSNGGNGSTVTWSVANGTGTATVLGSTLTAGDVGTVTVTAHQDEYSGTCGADVQQVVTIKTVTYTDYLTECSNDPSISVSPASVSGLGYVFGSAASASTVKTFTVTGSYLESNKVTITAPTGFEVKTSTGNFTDEIELTPNDGSINETISVRLSSGKTVNTYNGNVTVSCSGAGLESKTVALTGSVTAAKLTSPSVTATPGVHLITLTWSAVANADSYTVTCTGATVGDVTTSAGTCTCVLSNLTGGTEYSYSVVAVGSGNYANSDAAQGNATAGYQFYTVYWSINGVTDNVSVQEGQKVSAMHADPADGACPNKVFKGWRATAIDGEQDEVPSGMFTTVEGSPVITGNTTFYAVFAKQDGAGAATVAELTNSEITTNITNSQLSYDTEWSWADGDVTWAGKGYTDAANRKWIQVKAASGSYFKITVPTGKKITQVKVQISGATNASGGIADITKHTDFSGRAVLLAADAAVTASTEGLAYTETVTNYYVTLNQSNNYNTLYFKTSTGARIWSAEVTYQGDVTYSKYATTCSQLYDIVLDKNGGTANGSAKVLENGTTLTNITEPTYSGKGVVGYYKESGCTNKVANADGSLQANVAGYTDGDGKWIKDAGATLYTKWATLYSYSYTDDICDAGQAAEGAEVTLCTAPEVEHKDFTSWTVLAGDVPVTVTAGKFTMPASNVTITATYTQRTYTVTTNDNGVATDHVVNEGESYTMPALSCSGDDYTKVGWTATAPTDHAWATKPTIVNVGATVDAGGTYYAVYGEGSGDPTSFTKVTSSAGFESGANYMFVYNNDGTLYAMTGSFDTDHYTSTTVTATNDQISNSNSLYVWTIISNAGAISFQNVSTEKYIGIDQEQVCRKDKTSPVYPFELAWNGATVDVIRTESKSSEWGTDYLCASSSADYEFSIKYNDNNHYLYKSNGTMSYLSNPTCVTYYDITNITVDPAGYGSVDKTSVTHIPSGTTLSTNNNVLTVNTDPAVTVTATPTAATAQYTYAFDSWSNVPASVTGNINNIVANFTRTVNNYNVTATLTNVTAGTAFPAQLSYGGSFSTTISANTGYNLPASISVSGATSNWNSSTGALTISDVTGAVTVTISGQIKTYAVTLAKNEDWGTIDPTALADVNHETAISIDGSDSKILHVGGSTVTATPATNTAQYTYGWTGWTWEPAGATITAATTATATFTRTLNQYTITFENEDETVLQSGLVNYGETPVYSGATPTKDPTAQYTYTFAGWNPAITTVTHATTYTATYTPATRVYNVSTTLTHVSATPAIPTTVEYGGSITSIISADGGYNLPNDITVTGATVSTWNKSTGEMKLTNVTGDVSIKIEAELSGYKTLYLKPNSNWKSYSAKFALYDITHSKFTGEYMTAVGCETDIYSGEVPNSCVKVIFCRMDPSKGIDWDGKWNQTGDLNLDGTLYTITENSENWSAGSWSTFTPTTFTVSFNKNNGEGDDKASITNIGCQGSALLPTNDWTRTGYDANGWNTAADGSGTHYDDGATITDITANIPLYAEWSSNHPGTVTVSGTYHYWEGETIELTASVQYPERLKPSATYTWKRNGVVVEGQTTNVLSIPSCLFDNAGVYTCTVANGGAESTSSNFGVKILAFVLKNAEGSAISTTVLTKPAEGTVVVLPAFNLANENSTYKFCVIDGAGGRFGNDGQMTDKNCTNWAMDKDNDCRILTSGAGNYTFSVDYANIGQPKVSVTYPDHDQAENYPIYFDNSQGWSTDKLYYRIGASTTLCSEAMTLVPGTSRLYTTTTKEYNSFLAWHIGNNAGWTGDNSIYKTKTGDSYAITNSTSFIKSIVGETGVTVTITDQHSTGLSDENNNCEFYETATTAGLLTHTATVTAPMNGTIQLNWTDITGTAQEATATTAGLAHTCNLTITATPATGYELTSLTVNGNTFTSGQVHVLDADATIAAVFSAAVYSVTLNTNGGTINSGNVTSYTYGVGATLPTDVTKSGADFGGWFAESDFSGERVYSIGEEETGNKTFYALWTYLFAYNCNGGTCTGEYSTVCDTYMSVPEGTQMTVTSGTPTKTGYTFDGWQVNGAGEYLHGGDKVTVSQTTELVAHFTAQLVNYTVNHYQQNVDGTYPSSPTDVDNLQAYTGASVTPDRKDYGTGFNTPSGKQVTIAGDGSTVVNYQYSRTTHTITWTLDDGFDTQWHKQTSVRYGAQPSYKSSDPATSDCDYERVFVGWLDHKIAWADKVQVAPTGMFQKESAPTVSGDANYYAVFANYAEEVYSNYATACVKKYVITSFSDVNGNAITADFEQAAAGETVTLTVTTADGWKNKSYSVVKTTSQSTIVEVTDNQFTMPAYDVTVKATFVPVHRVFFHVPSGGCITAPATIELETSEVVPTLPAPTGTIPGGWTFAGWSLTEVTTESTTMPNLMYSGGYLENDVHVYALYQKAGTETLTFDQFLSGSTYNSAYFVISSLYSTAEHALPNTTVINGSDRIASTTITSVSDGMVTNASEIAATKMLFRKISSTEVQIMNVNNMFLDGKDGKLKLSTTATTWTKGSSGTQANPVRFTINSKALRINSTNEYGHYAASATQVNDTKILAISNNTVYYLTDADCIEKWYVTYDANGGETTCESGKKVAEDFTICADAPTRDHYTFGGWSDGVSTYDAGAAYSLTKNVTFTAQWTLVQHTVTFKNNGVTLDEGGTRQVGYGTAVGALPQLTEDQAVDCNGRSVIFMGWIEDEINPRTDGEPSPELQYISPSTVITGDKIYNAVWAEGVEEEVKP